MKSLYFLPHSVRGELGKHVVFLNRRVTLAGSVSLPHQTPYHTPSKFI